MSKLLCALDLSVRRLFGWGDPGFLDARWRTYGDLFLPADRMVAESVDAACKQMLERIMANGLTVAEPPYFSTRFVAGRALRLSELMGRDQHV